MGENDMSVEPIKTIELIYKELLEEVKKDLKNLEGKVTPEIYEKIFDIEISIGVIKQHLECVLFDLYEIKPFLEEREKIPLN